ncbi:MAG: pilus assembly protein PilM [bacterium]|nr:pilus assembly protein PilM [bacterium]
MADISFFKNIGFGKKFTLWSKGAKSITGIDLGLSSVKIVQLRREKERAVLETYGELSTGPYSGLSVGQATQLVDEKIVEMLKDLIKESGVTAKDVVLSIPLRSSFVTLIKVPFMSDAEINQMVPYEARKYIPVPIDEVVLDWWAIPEGFVQTKESGPEPDGNEPEQPEMEEKKRTVAILLVAIHKETITKYKEIMEKVGLSVRALEIEVFSIARSLLARELAPILLVDFGASSTKITVVDYGIVRSSHGIDRGSQDITMTISRALGIDFTRAEEMKREIGLSLRPEHREVHGVIEPMLNHVFSNALRVMQDYQRRHNRSVNRVILIGGGAKMYGLVDYAVKKFGIETTLGDPFRRIQYPAFLQPVLKEIGPSFAQAIGLAIREL